MRGAKSAQRNFPPFGVTISPTFHLLLELGLLDLLDLLDVLGLLTRLLIPSSQIHQNARRTRTPSL